MKTKRKTIFLSIALICLFAISISSNVNAAVDPEMIGVGYSDNYEITDVPIVISVSFWWADGSWQKLYWVKLEYNIGINNIDGSNVIKYNWDLSTANKRPTNVDLIFTQQHYLQEGDVVYFKISYEWRTGAGGIREVNLDKVHKFTIREAGYEEAVAERNLYLYIGAGVAVFLIIVIALITSRRRRS